jgi:hypothetical protein
LRRQINEAIDTAIARAGVSRNWVHGHFIHHRDGSYLVIPNLYSADNEKEGEAARALAMNHLAGVLTDMELVRWPRRGRWWLLQQGELDRLKHEEGVASATDLFEMRKQWANKHWSGEQPREGDPSHPLRNHGLFSKAERALEYAEWSEKACRDFEFYRLVDDEGLTPLLMVLNERDAGQGSDPRARTEAASTSA